MFAKKRRVPSAVFGRRDSCRLAQATSFGLAEGIGVGFFVSWEDHAMTV
jgi:hypothetical protein